MDKPGPQVFIQYVHEDRKVAERLAEDLRAVDIVVWIDREDLLPGQYWEDQVLAAINRAAHVITLLSRASSTKRSYFNRELSEALEVRAKTPRSHPYLIPVRLEQCQPDARLNEFHWVDLFPSYETGLRKILHSLDIAGALAECYVGSLPGGGESDDVADNADSAAGVEIELDADMSALALVGLRELFFEHAGDVPVFFLIRILDSSVRIAPPDRFSVRIDSSLLESIEAVAGPGSVRLIGQTVSDP